MLNHWGMTIGERIREARKARGLNRRELAERIGMPYPTLAGLENGDQAGSTKLHAIAAALGVRVDWLESGRGAQTGVADESPAYHPMGLDTSKLADLIETVEAAAIQARRQLSPRTKARLVASLYTSSASGDAVTAALASILATLED